jgi:hypothetical protein
LHHAEGVNILAKLRQDLAVEICRRFAADTASYYGAVFDDQTTSRAPDYERWLKQLLKDIKMQDRETI